MEIISVCKICKIRLSLNEFRAGLPVLALSFFLPCLVSQTYTQTGNHINWLQWKQVWLLTATLFCSLFRYHTHTICECIKMAEAHISVDLSCPVCLDPLKNPVTLPCSHNYCKVCINDYWDQEEEKGIYSCPQCRATFTQRPVLHVNNMLADVVEKLKKKKICSRHSEVLNIYCRNDQRFICSLCMLENHKGHDTVSVPVERAEKQVRTKNWSKN